MLRKDPAGAGGRRHRINARLWKSQYKPGIGQPQPGARLLGLGTLVGGGAKPPATPNLWISAASQQQVAPELTSGALRGHRAGR
jgi:hypothetical protein